MELKSFAEMAQEQPFLDGFSAGHIDKLAAMASAAQFAADQIIFRQGEESDVFYLLVSGQVALELGAPGRILRVQTLGEGDELGWSSFLEMETRRFQARCIEPARALSFDGARLRKACREDRDLGYALEHRLLQVVSNRLQAALLQLLDIYGPERGSHKTQQRKIAS